MSPFIPLTMFGWIPLIILLFATFPARRAVISGFLLAWMFLPQYSYGITGLPDYTKVSAMSAGILLGTALFNREIFLRQKPHLVDAPLIVWCLIPLFTSLANGLGAYDGASVTLGRLIMWGLPYLIGRLYFNDRQALTELSFGIFLGGLCYIPFCLWEVVMSPRLHKIVYGFHPHDFGQSKRGGGWRPVVFMEHGLMTAMWMVTAWLSGYQLWRAGWLNLTFPALRGVWGPAILLLLATVILCKSTGALGLLLLGVVVLHTVHATRMRLPILVLIIIPLLYVLTRGTGVWDGENLINAVSQVATTERTGSLAFRLENENILTVKAKERPLLGWGEWGRSFVRADDGRILSVPDGMWILAFGKSGVIGLTAILLTLLLPPLLFLHRYPPEAWRDPPLAAITVAPLLMCLFTIDSLFNDMFNPLIIILAGGLTGLWLNPNAGGQPVPATVPPPPPRTRLL
jgi:hypothetical protein